MIRCNLLCVGEATIIPRGFRNYGARCTDRSVLRRLAGSPSLTLLRNLTGENPKREPGGGLSGEYVTLKHFLRKKFYFVKKFII